MAKTARTVLVTGASRGLGLGIARQLAGAGYDVIALARQKTKPVTDAIAEAKRAKHGALHFVSFDLSEIDEIPGLVKGLRKDFGPLFGLVNNAAVGHDGALAMMHNSRDRRAGARQHAVAHRADQIRGALDDVGRRRPHRQCRLDHRLYRL